MSRPLAPKIRRKGFILFNDYIAYISILQILTYFLTNLPLKDSEKNVVLQ